VGQRAADLSAAAYAARLQSELGARPLRPVAVSEEHPALAWARSGAMALTGRADEAPRMCPVPLASAADGVVALVAALSPEPLPRDLDGARLLGERAAIAGHGRAGAVACGGACRMLPMASGDCIAVNLARADDFELLPAWLEQERVGDWDSLADALRRRDDAAELVARGRELGLAIARVDESHACAARWYREVASGSPGARRRERPRVLDLTALWAGPLCTHLLHLGGADVVKVEGRTRPDGARMGPPAFFDLLNAGKRCVALDLGDPRERAWLLALIDDADIVIEASRPRALRQLGIDAESRVRQRGDLSWIALSGHGREEPQASWIAYGDDAAIDAGLARVMRAATGELAFVGDAIADPLAGLHAALLAWWSWHRGGSRLLSVSLSQCVRHVVEWARCEDWRARNAAWETMRRDAGAPIAAPTARAIRAVAAPLGADTRPVVEALGPARPC
jgi:crotonobetainyl-CoA:carnitine CoA-transferase CaiB-like acyl-CoA transferase